MIIEEDGKLYNIDEETGLVTLASTSDAGLEDEPETGPWMPVQEFQAGERVEVEGKSGAVVAVTPSVYGDSIAVRNDDDGRVEEYPADLVTRANLAAYVANSDDPIAGLREQVTLYEGMPNFTLAEIEAKLEKANQIQMIAKTIIRQTSAVGDLAILDRIGFEMQVDVKELAEARAAALSSENSEYLINQPKYRMAENFSSSAPNMGMSATSADASWLELEGDDYDYTETTDSDLAARAVETVAYFDRTQLESDDFVRDAALFQATYLGIHHDDEKKARFASYVEKARKERLAEPVKEEKVASVEDDLDTFDVATIFV